MTKLHMEYGDGRQIWLDWMRVAACFMVMLTHCCEPFYLGGEGSLILTRADAVWVSILNVLPRAAVALFIFASATLQFPVQKPTGEFFRRRAARLLPPFIIWTVAYALVWGEPVQNFKDLLLNFNYAAGHLWFVYMLIGLYLLMPLLSPWAERVGRRELLVYLGIWLLTTTIPLIRGWIGGPAPVIYGPSGIPNAAKFPLWGEASWNSYGLFYYLSGFVGYMLMALYFKKFVPELSWRKTLLAAVPLFIVGFGIGCGGFLAAVDVDAGGSFPVEGPVGLAAIWETPWLNDGLSVALMTIAWVLLFRKIKGGSRFYGKVLLPVSKASYGMYLCHLLILSAVSAWIRGALDLGVEGALGPVWTTPVEILASTALSFCATALVCVLLQKIPRAGKWLIG